MQGIWKSPWFSMQRYKIKELCWDEAMLGQPTSSRPQSQLYHLPCGFPFKCFQVEHPVINLGCQLHQGRARQHASNTAHMRSNRVWKTRKRHRIQTEIWIGEYPDLVSFSQCEMHWLDNELIASSHYQHCSILHLLSAKYKVFWG